MNNHTNKFVQDSRLCYLIININIQLGYTLLIEITKIGISKFIIELFSTFLKLLLKN